MLDGFFGDQMLFTRGGYLVDLARTGRWIKVHRDLRQFAAWMTDADPGYFRQEFRRAFVRSLPPRWLSRHSPISTAGGRRWIAGGRDAAQAKAAPDS